MQNRQLAMDKIIKSRGYWPERIIAQIQYLDEYNQAHDNCFEDLLCKITAETEKLIEKDGALTKASAQKIEVLFAPATETLKNLTVHCCGHAHIDLSWYWGMDEAIMVCIETANTMLKLLEEYPDFKFSQSQAHAYRFIEEYAPEMLPKIKEYVAQGRWEPTAVNWVEADKNMPNGESHARHLLYTKRYLKKLLGLYNDQYFQVLFEPDTFGHSTNIPEIATKAGVKYMYHMRGYSGPHYAYRWRAPSGAEIISWKEPINYNSNIEYNQLGYLVRVAKTHDLDQVLLQYGCGDHGGGVTRRDIERLLDMMTWPGLPTIKFSRLIDFYSYLETIKERLPIVDTELNFIFDGCYTSLSKVKQGNRASEILLNQSEYYNTISSLVANTKYYNEKFETAWKKVLFNQFHDILPGTCCDAAKEYATGQYLEAGAMGGARLNLAIRTLSSKINTAKMLPYTEPDKLSISEGSGAGTRSKEHLFTLTSRQSGINRLFNIYNPTQFKRRETVVLFLFDWEGNPSRLRVTDEDGNPIEHQVLDHDQLEYWTPHYYRRILADVEVIPFGYRTVLISGDDDSFITPSPIGKYWDASSVRKGETLENDYVKAVFDDITYELISYVDKRTGKEFIKSGGSAGLAYVKEDARSNAWMIGRSVNITKPLGKVTSVGGSKHVGKKGNPGNNGRIGNPGDLLQSITYNVKTHDSAVNVTVFLDKYSPILEYRLEVVWRELGTETTYVPRLDYVVPLTFTPDSFIYDTACGLVTRRGLKHDVPASSFAFAPDGDSGLMLISDSKHGFGCYGDTMKLSLIRSTYFPNPIPEVHDHIIRFAICPFGSYDNMSLLEASANFCIPMTTVPASSNTGELDTRGSFASVTSGDIIISAIKIAEDDPKAMIVRLYEASGVDGNASISFLQKPKSTEIVDLHEKFTDTENPNISGNMVSFGISKYEVISLKVVF